MSADAIVVGSGPNGLAAAITLAEAGVSVEVHEAAGVAGGGLRSEELTLPGFTHDVCSAIYPFATGSPFFRNLELDVEWIHPATVAAHPLDDGSAVALERSVEATAARLGVDGEAYANLIGPLVRGWDAIEPVLLGALPPPPRTVAALARALGARGLARALRAALADARSVCERVFSTEPARGFFAGHAAHSIIPLEKRPSAAFGLALLVLGHAHSWPIPRGGAQRIAEALLRRLHELGGVVRVDSPVDELPDARLVLADVSPRELLRIARGRLPDRYARALRHFRYGPAAFKLDWALDAPIPWRADECRSAGTVHLGATLDEIAASERAAWAGHAPARPFVLLSQPTVFDSSRAPAGRHTAWAYCHVPNGFRGDVADRVEAQVERFAPGFRDRIVGRSVMGPADFEAHNRNLVGGDLAGGALDLAQVVFRPARRLVPYRTPRSGLYLCSASTPPGGGVHGMCGQAAALVALADLAAGRA